MASNCCSPIERSRWAGSRDRDDLLCGPGAWRAAFFRRLQGRHLLPWRLQVCASERIWDVSRRHHSVPVRLEAREGRRSCELDSRHAAPTRQTRAVPGGGDPLAPPRNTRSQTRRLCALAQAAASAAPGWPGITKAGRGRRSCACDQFLCPRAPPIQFHPQNDPLIGDAATHVGRAKRGSRYTGWILSRVFGVNLGGDSDQNRSLWLSKGTMVGRWGVNAGYDPWWTPKPKGGVGCGVAGSPHPLPRLPARGRECYMGCSFCTGRSCVRGEVGPSAAASVGSCFPCQHTHR